jgi:hypothetical protein
MGSEPYSVTCATLAGKTSTTGKNTYPEGTPEAEAWQVAYKAAEGERLRLADYLHARIPQCIDAVIEARRVLAAEREDLLATVERFAEIEPDPETDARVIEARRVLAESVDSRKHPA